MSNFFKFHGAKINTTSELTLLLVPANSTYIVSSIIISNTSVSTDNTISLTVTDSSQLLDFNILTSEPINRTISKEILTRPLVLENGDALKVQSPLGNVYDVLVSYMDRSRS